MRSRRRPDRVPSTIMVVPVDLSDVAEEAVAWAAVNMPEREIQSAEVRPGWGIVPTPEGLYALCTEGVGPGEVVTIEKPLEVEVFESARIGNREGQTLISVMAFSIVSLDNLDLLARTTTDSVVLADFIRSFGDRLDDNYNAWRLRLQAAMRGGE
jgi:hypothetical protein